MALSIRGLCRLSLGLTNNIFSKTHLLNGVRFIYSEKSLGITAYENTRYLLRNQFVTIEDTFRNKMLDVCSREDGVIFTEDLKAMLHLAQKSNADMELINKMIEKYLISKQEMKFGSYTFGPIVMRMFYYLNEPEVALSAYNNPSLADFFNQKATIQILMCLLYKHDMYNEMKELYEKVYNNESQKGLTKYCLVVMIAACYKLNTSEALEFAITCWKRMSELDYRPSSRSSTLLGALALRQNAPEMTLEILSTIQRQQFIDVRCLKVLAYMSLKKYVQIVPLLKYSVEQDITPNRRQTYFADVIYALEEKLRHENVQDMTELFHLIEDLKKQERLTTHVTLEESLLKPINFTTRNDRAQLETRRDLTRERPRAGIRNFL